MLNGETLASGAPTVCPDCEEQLRLDVFSSQAGYYIGVMCLCGPYSRESRYYTDHEQAEEALKTGLFWR